MRHNESTLWFAAASLILASACARHSADAPSPRTAGDQEADGAAADIVAHHRHHHHGGALMLIAMSLDNLGVPPDVQGRIDQIQQGLLADLRPARAAERDLATLLADEVAASSFDPAKIDAAVERIAVASGTAHAGAAEELNHLHDLLTAPQRAALADKLEAHWALWKQANSGAQDRGATIGREIGLRPDQLEKLNAELAAQTTASQGRAEEIERHLREFEAAFQAGTFDARSLSMGAANATQGMVTWSATRLARFCEAAAPLATDEQRRNLETLLREHSTHGPERGQEGGRP